jgi:hypothetical protein
MPVTWYEVTSTVDHPLGRMICVAATYTPSDVGECLLGQGYADVHSEGLVLVCLRHSLDRR